MSEEHDPFADIWQGRGSGRYENEPRFMEPPESSSSPLASFADLRRRYRPGVLITVDALDDVGQVIERKEGAVTGARYAGDPHDTYRDDAGGTWALRWPSRASHRKLDGASIEFLSGGKPTLRVTITDESSAGPPLVKRVPKPPGLGSESRRGIRERLGELMDVEAPRWRFFGEPPGQSSDGQPSPRLMAGTSPLPQSEPADVRRTRLPNTA